MLFILAQSGFHGGVWEKAADYQSQVGRKVAARNAGLDFNSVS